MQPRRARASPGHAVLAEVLAGLLAGRDDLPGGGNLRHCRSIGGVLSRRGLRRRRRSTLRYSMTACCGGRARAADARISGIAGRQPSIVHEGKTWPMGPCGTCTCLLASSGLSASDSRRRYASAVCGTPRGGGQPSMPLDRSDREAGVHCWLCIIAAIGTAKLGLVSGPSASEQPCMHQLLFEVPAT